MQNASLENNTDYAITLSIEKRIILKDGAHKGYGCWYSGIVVIGIYSGLYDLLQSTQPND